jgi:hypothetical protein
MPPPSHIIGYTQSGAPIFGTAGAYTAAETAGAAISAMDALGVLVSNVWAFLSTPIVLITIGLGFTGVMLYVFRAKISAALFPPRVYRLGGEHTTAEMYQHMLRNPVPVVITDGKGNLYAPQGDGVERVPAGQPGQPPAPGAAPPGVPPANRVV